MADYWGLKSIAQRMNWRYERTPVRQAISTGFPIFKRRKGRHLVWFTEDSLISIWQLQRVKLNRDELIQKASARGKDQNATSRS